MASSGDTPDPSSPAPESLPPAGPPAESPAAQAAPAPRRSHRWPHALGMLTWLLIAIALPAATVWALLNHPRALPLLLSVAPGLKADGVEGTLAGGRIRIARLDWTLPAKAGELHLEGLALDGLAAGRAPHAGAWFALRWQALSADAVRYTPGPPSGTPPKPPADLLLPLTVEPSPVTVARLDIAGVPTITAARAVLAVGADGGERHRVDGLQLQLAGIDLRGALAIGARAPLAVQARLDAAAPNAQPPWQAAARAEGPLGRLSVRAELHGQAQGEHPAPSLNAEATVTPFAPWPLAALALDTQALDLSSLAPALPRTLLDGRATIASAGLKAPLAVQATLVNRLPGEIDAHRVPVRRLAVDLKGRLDQTDRATLEHFELQLGNAQAAAGRASGSGRWQGDTLALDLQLDELQPARLHGGAAALSISGPLALQVRGLPQPGAAASAPRAEPQFAVQATLAGRALDGAGLPVKIHLEGSASRRQVTVRQAEATAGTAQAAFTLDASAQPQGWRVRGDARLARFDPLPWWRGNVGSAWRRGPHRLNATLQADVLWRGMPPAGLLLDQLLLAADGNATLHLADSVVAGVPVEADWTLRSGGREVTLDTRSTVAGNLLRVDGRTGGAPAADRWQLELQAPALPALLPLRTLAAELAPEAAAQITAWWPTEGQAGAHMVVQGRWPALRTEGEAKVDALKAPALQLRQAAVRWRAGDEVDAPLLLDLDAQGLQVGGQRVEQVEAQASGNLRQHTLHFRADSALKPPAWTENLLGPAGTGTRAEGRATGSWTPAEGGGGTWRMRGLHIDGGARDAQGGSRPWLVADGLSAEVQLDPEGRPLAAALAPGRLQLLTTALRWREAQWQAAAPGSGRALPSYSFLGEIETIDAARLLARAQPDTGWSGDLTLAGRVELRSAERLDADVVLERRGGDLALTDELGNVQPLGITELRLALSAHDGLWQFAQGVAGRSVGEMAGAQVLRTGAERRWPTADSPLMGVLEARVSNLGIWAAWLPPGWRLGGTLRTNASFGGTLGAPEVTGAMQGTQLSVRNVLLGVNLVDGDLAMGLTGDRTRVERLRFRGGDGELSVTGGGTLGAAPQLDLALVAERFRVLGRIDRRIVTSGRADLHVDAQQVKLDGRLAIDEGLVDISQSDAPKLDPDVKVHRAGDEAAERAANGSAAPLPAPLRNARIDLAVDLGEKLRLRGRGIDTGLRGELRLTSPAGRLAVNGTVHGDGGTYAAYGQNLEITRGDLVFSGPLDNPRLDVQATRPNLDVLVGVAITGTALNPRVRLFSEPELAEYDKLSWLVLGRSPDGLGRTDTALLQRAAMALLAGDGKGPTDSLLDSVGLTDFSLRQTEGTVRETVVSLGKQLSRRWYLGYERSVNATTGTWQLVYRVAQRFTLRAQSGTENAVDAIWSWRW